MDEVTPRLFQPQSFCDPVITRKSTTSTTMLDSKLEQEICGTVAELRRDGSGVLVYVCELVTTNINKAEVVIPSLP